MSDHIKRFMPQRVASQITMLVVGSIILTYIVIASVFFFVNPSPDWVKATAAAVARLVFTAKMLDAAPNADARANIIESAKNDFPKLELIDAGSLMETRSDDPIVRSAQIELGQRFQAFTTSTAPDRRMMMGVRLPDGKALIAPIEFRHTLPRFSAALIATLAFFISAVSLLSFWAARAITAPLTNFANAADRFRLDDSDSPLPERGPKEILRAAKALNGMRERIRRLVEDRGQMLAAISHDLRTPITRLRLRAEDIKQEALKDQVIGDLETMQTMVHDALQFLRGQSAINALVSVDLLSLVQTICDNFTDFRHNVHFIGEPNIYVESDPGQLSRAITNLVENGLKFGSVVKIRFAAAGDENVVIDVQDDGPGIPDADKRRVMEPFFRGDLARSLDRQQSFGLGLSISRTIIEAHKGSLELLDAEPRGLLARITLPKTMKHLKIEGDFRHKVLRS